MASLSIINKVKYSPWLYNLYYYCGSIGIKVLRLFIKKDSRLIIFSSYGGRKYDDSPKCIYEQMIRDSRFDSFHITWAFMNPEKYEIPRGNKVKADTLAYFTLLLKAKCWITNTTMERGLNISNKGVYYFNAWHGTPIKHMGGDIEKSNLTFNTKNTECPYDVFCAQSQYDADIYGRGFKIPSDIIKIIGYPRNDELANNTGNVRIEKIKGKLGIPDNKKVILYAPTFREYTKDDNMNCIIAPPVHFDKWKDYLGNDYVLLFRAHYEVVKVMNVVSDDFVKDVSSYPYLNELMIVSDILISDYSSIFFDYSIMGKPMLCFSYDFDEYQEKRGMYFDIRQELDCMGMETEDVVIDNILNIDMARREVITKCFRDKYVSSYGQATKQSLDLIYNAIK